MECPACEFELIWQLIGNTMVVCQRIMSNLMWNATYKYKYINDILST